MDVSKSVIIGSKDRAPGSLSVSNFKVDLSAQGKEPNSKVVLSHISIPHTWKNINGFTDTIKMNECGLGDRTISSIGTGANPIVTVTSTHLMSTGFNVDISGSDSTPDIDGTGLVVTVLSGTTFSLDTPPNGAVTIVGTTGTVDQRCSPNYTFSLTNGNYNATELATQMIIDFEAASLANSFGTTTYEITYDANADTFTIYTGVVGRTLEIFWAESLSRRILGFTEGATASGPETYISDLSPLVSGIQTINLEINNFEDGINTENLNQLDTMIEIPITSTFGEQLIYSPTFTDFMFAIRNFHSLVTIRLTVNYNNGTGRIDLPTDSDWSMFLVDIESDKQFIKGDVKGDQFITNKTGF